MTDNSETIGELIKQLENASVIWAVFVALGFACAREIGWLVVLFLILWG